MASGGKRVVVNNLERALSEHHNQNAAFAAASLASVVAAGLAQIGDGAVPVVRNHLLNALVLHGLLVRPDPGTYVTVDPGAAAFVDPAFSADPNDGSTILAYTDGLFAATLAFVANGLGQMRVDVFECRPVIATTNDSRDIFNPATELFTPAAVAVEQRFEIEYRVRRGNPALVEDPDWLPLAVAFVKTTDASYATCDFYDVRPLLAERVGMSDRAAGTAVTALDFDCNTGAVKGVVRGQAFGFLAGCQAAVFDGGAFEKIRRTAPVSAAAYFNAAGDPTGGTLDRVEWTPDNVANGFAPANEQPVGLFCVFPALSTTPLPRWQRYAQGAAPREPTGPRGLFVFDTLSKGGAMYLTSTVTLPAPIVNCLAPNAQGLVAGMGWFNNATTSLFRVRGSGGQIGIPDVTAKTLAANAIASGGGTSTVTWSSISVQTHLALLPSWARGADLEAEILVPLDGGGPAAGVALCNIYADETDGLVYLGRDVLNVMTSNSGPVRAPTKLIPVVVPSGIEWPTIKLQNVVGQTTNFGFDATASNHVLYVRSLRYW